MNSLIHVERWLLWSGFQIRKQQHAPDWLGLSVTSDLWPFFFLLSGAETQRTMWNRASDSPQTRSQTRSQTHSQTSQTPSAQAPLHVIHWASRLRFPQAPAEVAMLPAPPPPPAAQNQSAAAQQRQQVRCGRPERSREERAVCGLNIAQMKAPSRRTVTYSSAWLLLHIRRHFPSVLPPAEGRRCGSFIRRVRAVFPPGGWMEAAAEGAVGLSEAGDGSPLSGAAASDDGDTVVGVSYGMDAADMGRSAPVRQTTECVFHYPRAHWRVKSPMMPPWPKVPTHLS